MSPGARSARSPSAIVVAAAIAAAIATTPVAPRHLAAGETSEALRWEQAGRSPPSPASEANRLDLDLDREARPPIGPAIEALTRHLREEIQRLDAGPATLADRVARGLRERAVLLLEARGGEADIAALAGLRLAMSRGAVDRYATDTLASTDDLGARRLAAWRALLLERFADRSLEDLRDAVTGRRGLDAPLARSMTPLLEAMIAGTNHVPGDHWPIAAAHRDDAATPSTTDRDRRAGSTDARPAASPELQSSFHSWRRRAERAGVSVRAIDRLREAVVVIAAADHLPMPLRERLRAETKNRLDDASDVEDDTAVLERSAGPRVGWIRGVADLLEAIDAAAQRSDRSRRTRSMLVEEILQPLVMAEDDPEDFDAREAMLQAAAALDRATLASRIANRPIRRELRATRTTLRRRAIEAESLWISRFADRLAEGGVDRSATRATGLAHIADLERLQRLSRLVDRIAGLEPRKAVDAAIRARDLAAPLVEPLKRSTAVERIDATLAASPFRSTLLDGGAPPLAEADTLRSDLETLRRDWIVAWIVGGDATTALESKADVLRSLLAISERVTALEASVVDDSPGRRVDHWAAWWVRPEAIDAAIGTLAPRLALATTAWLRGDLPAARRSLQAIRETMPIAAFAIEVDRTIGSRLAPLSGGALGVVESLALPPGPEAWFPLPRRDLARLSLLEFERRAALAAGRDADAERLRLEIAASLAGPRR